MFLELFNSGRKKRLTFDQAQILQLVAQQVVTSLEGTLKVPGGVKKAVALDLVNQILKEVGVVAPDSLVDTSIEASVKILKMLDKQDEAIKKPFNPLSVDISGRPKSGN